MTRSPAVTAVAISSALTALLIATTVLAEEKTPAAPPAPPATTQSTTTTTTTTQAASTDEAVAAFADVYRVLESPRCVNCHPKGDAPRVGDNHEEHPMEVRRGLERVGMACNTCHRATPSLASRKVGAPPAVPNWGLPPDDHRLVFEGKTQAELCEQLKNPATNGNKDAAALNEHVTSDSLVLYGWDPGGKRTTPPLTHEQFVAKFKTWTAAGMPCPTAPTRQTN